MQYYNRCRQTKRNEAGHICENACKKKTQIMCSGQQTEVVPGIWKKCEKFGTMNHFNEICRSSKSSAVHKWIKKQSRNKETDMETVKINSIRLYSDHSAIIANLKISSYKVITTVLYKVDMGSNGNIMPF